VSYNVMDITCQNWRRLLAVSFV